MGIRVGKDNLFTVFFVDDQFVIEEDKHDRIVMMRKLQEEYVVTGSTMNTPWIRYPLGNTTQLCQLGNNYVILGATTFFSLRVLCSQPNYSRPTI